MEKIRDGKNTHYVQDLVGYKLSEWNEVIDYNERLICFNTLSGAIYLFENEEYKMLEAGEFQTERDLQDLMQSGIIVSNDCDERETWMTLYREARRTKKSADITICVTNKCQFRCIYCFEGLNKNETSMRADTVEDVKQYLKSSFPDLEELYVTWFGGEPLLGMAQIVKLSTFFIEYCKSKKASYFAYMTTNGYALTPSTFKVLNDKCLIKSYTITVDGPSYVHDKRRPLRSGHGTYSIIWNNMQNAVSMGASIALRVTVDKTNIKNIPTLIDEIASSTMKGNVFVCFARTFDFSFTPKEISETIYNQAEFASVELELLKYAEQKGICKILPPWASPLGGCIRDADITIGVDGKIYKCLDTIGEENWVIGNIKDGGCFTTNQWEKDWQTWMPTDSDECRKCKLLPLCNGGCPHNALFVDKKHYSNGHCPDWKFNYKNKIRHFVNKALK